jgi:hypothetical protein
MHCPLRSRSPKTQIRTSLSQKRSCCCWHARIGHLSFRKIQFLMRAGTLSRSKSTRRLQVAASKLSHLPLCAACQFGKQSQRPSRGQKKRRLSRTALVSRRPLTSFPVYVSLPIISCVPPRADCSHRQARPMRMRGTLEDACLSIMQRTMFISNSKHVSTLTRLSVPRAHTNSCAATTALFLSRLSPTMVNLRVQRLLSASL